MRRPLLTAVLAVVAVLGASACSSGSGPEAAPATGDARYVTAGKLTIATAEPAYSPWVENDDPASGEGFEAAVAYAVADRLGFARDDVVWTRTTFDEAIAPGPKDFDLNLQQFSITDERRNAVDFSTPYYETTQVAITVEGSPAASATTLADLKPLRIGAQTGTTSLDAVDASIAPDGGAQVFNTNDDAKLALQNGTIDALVVDLPTAFYLVGAELDGGTILGQLPDSAGGDQFGIVLEKDSPLTADVSAAVDALRADGTLDELARTWLGGEGAAPVLH
ncbi:amino acid ABC transporter substrate-binding protein [Xylanimonas allomyrinae]|uniref:Amino acid ABC transporter substrate-binding protein n=1 Tax=Xylanimonas allomyrinae TaxID=2509459 RepID=A0A4P6ELA9_9MICO|nr:transporter substrate-binding domain-containing protein [Xylanimonas allomyrinae]QAY63026.1 amino acid ABC transporter substrate-binding protein [Xylanimonas allomyrinae]